MDVVGSIGGLPVSLPPGGDALVDGVGVIPAAALWQGRLPVEYVNRVVVGSVLLGSVVANRMAADWITAQSKFQGADHPFGT